MIYEQHFLISLILTIGIETLVLLFFLKKEIPLPKILLGGIFASGITLPYIWFIFPMFFKTHLLYTIISELFALFGEAYFYHIFLQKKFSYTLLLSFFANTLSFLTGLFIV